MKLPALALLLTLSACSSSAPTPPALDGPVVERVELFMSRASITQVDFEQFVVSGGTLFHECGRVSQGRQFPAAHGVVALAPETQQELTALATAARENAQEQWQPAGSNKHLADPGVFTLSLQVDGSRRTLRTSLDSIANGETLGRKRLRALAEAVRRASGGKLCDYTSFYGVG